MEPLRPAEEETEVATRQEAAEVGRLSPLFPRLNGHTSAASEHPRVTVRGTSFWRGDRKLYLRGVTYGTFRPRPDGYEYPLPEVVETDFAAMREAGCNAVRTYTPPPRWLLDLAHHHQLLVMVGLPWEQHVTFLDERDRARDIERRVRSAVRGCAGHPAVLAYAVGNEIPSSIARWHGHGRIERYIKRLYRAAKEEDAEALVTYVNFPSTEYLELPFVDFVSFNVYLEAQRSLEGYLRRLHNQAGNRPLVMTEIGLDSRRHGLEAQAATLGWQIETAFGSGCAGAFVFSWTDEWHRGGHDIHDWDFGLTTRDRRPKPALDAVRDAFDAVPFRRDETWPRISIVIASCNGAATLPGCLEALERIDYDDHEVIVVDDGSTDDTADIARAHGARVIQHENRGLGAARNSGIAAATGDIVAFIDDDAYPDPDWLQYLAASFRASEHAGVGGPNLPPPEDPTIAQCVAHAPGGPTHVLYADDLAEHIPGCNSAFRREALLQIGGFDPRFTAAGDDVDVCWRLQEAGHSIGFNPAALVWHHRRNSVRAYWRHQRGYGKAEALVERKWPEKYNAVGHLPWQGRIYGRVPRPLSRHRQRVYYGTWGTGFFQPMYDASSGKLAWIPLLPEWWLVVATLAALTAAGLLWSPLLAFVAPLTVAVAAILVPPIRGMGAMRFPPHSAVPRRLRIAMRALTGFLYLIQPLARLRGRFKHGLTPWRRLNGHMRVPRPRRSAHWSEHWRSAEERLREIAADLIATGALVVRGHAYARWDLEVQAGVLGGIRMRMAIEEHGEGKQFVRIHSWPRPTATAVGITGLFCAIAVAAITEGQWIVAGILGIVSIVLAAATVGACASAAAPVARIHSGGPARRRTRGRDGAEVVSVPLGLDQPGL